MDKPTGDVEAWANKWNALRREGLRLKIPDFGSANCDFLQAVKEVTPVWWEEKYHDIVEKDTIWDTDELVNDFLITYCLIRDVSQQLRNASQAAFASPHGHGETNPTLKRKKKQAWKREFEQPVLVDRQRCQRGEALLKGQTPIDEA
ncbi:hypothetical protein N7523_000044 [Penicillium sp. IBT 18751x]|nr:hypothetical protein N7523_000044 [Penicillium sp. IBT 18751x]